MTKKQQTAYLALGIALGLFVTACAGVATGPVDLPDVGEVFTIGPAVDAQSLPALEVARPAHSARFVFEKARPIEIQNMDSETEALPLQSLTAVQSAMETVQQSQVLYSEHLCSRGDH